MTAESIWLKAPDRMWPLVADIISKCGIACVDATIETAPAKLRPRQRGEAVKLRCSRDSARVIVWLDRHTNDFSILVISAGDGLFDLKQGSIHLRDEIARLLVECGAIYHGGCSNGIPEP